MIVDKFFCCSLKTGAVTVGVILIFYGFIMACVNFYGFFGDQHMITCSLWLNIVINVGGRVDFGEAGDGLDLFMVALVVSFSFNILRILAASSLLFGAFSNKPAFILPVLILIIADLVVGWIFTIVILRFNNNPSSIIIIMVIRSIIWGFCWVCIFCFWQQLKEEGRNRKLQLSLENSSESVNSQ